MSCSDCGRSGKRRGRPPKSPARPTTPTPCYHLVNRVCERHRALRDPVRRNGVVEILSSMSYPAADFDSFASRTRLLENCDYARPSPLSPHSPLTPHSPPSPLTPHSPPSSRQSPARDTLELLVNGNGN